jgi:hypothetical protein
MFWSALREAQLLTFLVMRGQWLRGIVPREAAWQQNGGRSRDDNDDGQARAPTEQIAGTSVNCYSSQAFGPEAHPWSALVAATQ